MVALLKLWNRGPRVEVQEPEAEAAPAVAVIERLHMLVPEGGFSYRIFSFATLEEAEEYVEANSLQLPRTGIVTFWAQDSETASANGASGSGAAEAVLMIRNPNAPAAVQLYTFKDFDGAHAFLRDSIAGGLDPSLVLLHWAEFVELEVPVKARTPRAAAKPAPPKPARDVLAPAKPAAPEPEPAAEPSAPPEAPRQATARRRAEGAHKARARAEDAPAPTPTAEEVSPAEAAAGSPRTSALARFYYWHGWDRLLARMIAATLLKQDVYDLARRDPAATGRAMLIVSLGALAAGIGTLKSGLFVAFFHVLAGLTGWAVFAATAYVVGVHFFGGRRTRGSEYFKVAGLASSVAVLLVLGAVPVFGPLFVLAVSVWMAVATATALMYVLELERDPALLSVTMGWFGFFAVAQVAPLVLLG